MRIHQILMRTRANGPGIRLGLWLQGCSRKCLGCSNPETHDKTEGYDLSLNEIYTMILDSENCIDGVSISGGEPLEQIEELMELLKFIRFKTSLTTILWTGYSLKEIHRITDFNKISKLVDLMIIGPYIQKLHEPKGLKGSSNQEYLFITSKYTEEDLLNIPDTEIIFEEGEIKITGINTEQVKSWIK